MKVIIAGSRIFDDREPYFYKVLEKLVNRFEEIHECKIECVVSGTAKGPDRIGEKWAYANGIPVHKFTPDWKQFGKVAGLMRNVVMGDFADGAIIMWDGQSRGSSHMRDVMINLGKPFILDILEPIHYNYEHTPSGTIEQFLGSKPQN